MRQVEVHIMQQSYLLSCPEGREARLIEAVERVDDAMTRIRDTGKVRARDRIAVLVALNFAFEISNHEAAAQQAAASPVVAASPQAEQPLDDERLNDLVRRLDEALGQDDRLP